MKLRKFLNGEYMCLAPADDPGDLSGSDDGIKDEIDESTSPLAEVVNPDEHGTTGPTADGNSAVDDNASADDNASVDDNASADDNASVDADFEIEIDESSPLSEEEFDFLVEHAEKHNLDKEQTEALIKRHEGFYAKAIEDVNMSHKEKQRELRSQMMNDPEFGGAKFKESLEVMARPIQAFGDDAFKQLVRSEVGNQPALARFLFKIGKLMESDSFVGSGISKQPEEVDVLKQLYPSFYD